MVSGKGEKQKKKKRGRVKRKKKKNKEGGRKIKYHGRKRPDDE